MKRSVATLVLLCGLLLGCQSTGRKDLMTRDLRLQEDRIYELEDMVEQLECELESCRRGEGIRSGYSSASSDTSSSSSGGSYSSPSVDLPPGISGPSKPTP